MSVIYQPTPTVQDQYSRNYMQLFDELEIIGASTLFLGFFAKPNSNTLFSPDANSVDIDVMRGNERLAALVPRGTISQKLGDLQKDTLSQRYSAFSRSFPLIEEEGSINANQIINRLAGETPSQRISRQTRMRVLAGRENQEQIRRIIRLCEYLASQSILTAKMPAILGTTDDELIYNFHRHNDHFVTLAQSWWTADHDILSDCYDAWKLGRVNGHVSMDGMLVGEDTMAAIANSNQLKEFADNRRIGYVELGDKTPPQKFQWMIEAGANCTGTLVLPEGPKFWVFTYLDGFTNDAGEFSEFMPTENALFFYSDARTDRYFGPPERLPVTATERSWYQEMFGFNMDTPPVPPNIKGIRSVSPSAMMYFDAYPSQDKKKIVPRVQAAPIYAPIQTDAYVTILNAGTPT